MNNWIKRAVLGAWTESTNPKATVNGRLGEKHEVEVIMPFGLSYCPPDGAEAIIMPGQGSNDLLFSSGFSGGDYRPKPDKGGSMLYSTASGTMVYAKPDGSVLITTQDGGSFSLSGTKITTNMTIETSGDVIADGVSLKNHVHGGVFAGGSATSSPL